MPRGFFARSILFSLCAAGPLRAAATAAVLGSGTLHVPADYPTIQSAIDATTNGDTVLVAPGTYFENIRFAGKSILVTSEFLHTNHDSTIASTVIDGRSLDTVVRFENQEDSTAALLGFTLRNGLSLYGAGIRCVGTSPRLLHLNIHDNVATDYGGGIAGANSASPIVLACRIAHNKARHGGGLSGLAVGFGAIVIGQPNARCNIYDNDATESKDDLWVFSPNTVYCDTFTVLDPDEGLVTPGLALDILTGFFAPIAADLYVAPYGSNDNDGLTFFTPLKNIYVALHHARPLAGDTLQIHIQPGTYSSALTGERDLTARSFVSLAGTDSATTILDLEQHIGSQGIAISCVQDSSFEISGLGIRQGGIACVGSNPVIRDCSFSGGLYNSGGVSCADRARPAILNNRFQAAGVSCVEGSNPLIQGNTFLDSGIHLDASSPEIRNNSISGSRGILCNYFCSPRIDGNLIFGNEIGGIICIDSDPSITNNVIRDNIAEAGGGIYLRSSNATIDHNEILANSAYRVGGGAIYCERSNPIITRNTIAGNSARVREDTEGPTQRGGAIYLTEGSDPVIGGSPENGNVFTNNWAPAAGQELFAGSFQGVVNARNNTFDIFPLSALYAFPPSRFDVAGGTGTAPPITQDVFVSPTGSDENDGLSFASPLATVRSATRRILPTAFTSRTIHLDAGLYSASDPGQSFPIVLFEGVSVVGQGFERTTLDAEGTGPVLVAIDAGSGTIAGLRMQGGVSGAGGGIYCESSSLTIAGNHITGNQARWGAGIYCLQASPTIVNTVVRQNTTSPATFSSLLGGGIFCNDQSSPVIRNVLVSDNFSLEYGGGIAVNQNSHPRIVNATVTGNEAADEGGGFLIWNSSDVTVENSILWGNAAPTNPTIALCCESSATISWSDVEGTWSGTGNLDVNPGFGSGIRYYLGGSSACVDAGDPAAGSNDPIDVSGAALFPARGGARNDMGAYGGPQSRELFSAYTAVLIQEFQAQYEDERGVVVRWRVSDAPSVQRYSIYRSIAEDHGFETLAVLEAKDAVEYTDPTGERGHTYWYRLGAVDEEGETLSPTVAVAVPAAVWALHPGRPNPFNPHTTIHFEVARAGRVNLSIFDARGRLVRVLLDANMPAGKHRIAWDGRDGNGSPVSSGVYQDRLSAGAVRLARKLVLVR